MNAVFTIKVGRIYIIGTLKRIMTDAELIQILIQSLSALATIIMAIVAYFTFKTVKTQSRTIGQQTDYIKRQVAMNAPQIYFVGEYPKFPVAININQTRFDIPIKVGNCGNSPGRYYFKIESDAALRFYSSRFAKNGANPAKQKANYALEPTQNSQEIMVTCELPLDLPRTFTIRIVLETETYDAENEVEERQQKYEKVNGQYVALVEE